MQIRIGMNIRLAKHYCFPVTQELQKQICSTQLCLAKYCLDYFAKMLSACPIVLEWKAVMLLIREHGSVSLCRDRSENKMATSSARISVQMLKLHLEW